MIILKCPSKLHIHVILLTQFIIIISTPFNFLAFFIISLSLVLLTFTTSSLAVRGNEEDALKVSLGNIFDYVFIWKKFCTFC